jgi:hypothetical protein
MKLALLLFFLTFSSVYAQIAGEKSIKPYTAQDGTVFKVGDTLRIGVGTNADSSFHFIYTADASKPLEGKYQKRFFGLKNFLINGNKVYAVTTPMAGVGYVAELDQAIAAGEIVSKSAAASWVYSEVIQIPGRSKADLYSNAKAWFAKAFVSANNVLQNQDMESGSLIGKGSTKVTVKNMGIQDAGHVLFTLEIRVKEDKYKYTISDFHHEGARNFVSIGSLNQEKSGTMNVTAKQWQSIKEQADGSARQLINSLKLAMIAKPDDF